jgi:hypothetical protein
MTTNFTKRPDIIPNGRKIFEMVKNLTAFSIPRPSKFYPKWDLGFENKPSGNPGIYLCIFSSATREHFFKRGLGTKLAPGRVGAI